MKSPFPGMDPYLERRWSDIHTALLTFTKEALQPRLPAGLRARSEERVVLEDGEDRRTSDYRADVAVVVTGRPQAAAAPSGAAVADSPVVPVVLEYTREPDVDRFLQIIDTTAGNRVVTAIELLSRANKAGGPVNRLYRRKLRDYARARVNVVEVDLLRGPRTRLRVRRDDLPVDQRTPYMACVRRSTPFERWECFPIPLRDRLPVIPIPLRRGDPDAALDLQPLLDRAYVAGGHDDIDYNLPPRPRLSPADAAWADALLRAAGRRA